MVVDRSGGRLERTPIGMSAERHEVGYVMCKAIGVGFAEVRINFRIVASDSWRDDSALLWSDGPIIWLCLSAPFEPTTNAF